MFTSIFFVMKQNSRGKLGILEANALKKLSEKCINITALKGLSSLLTIDQLRIFESWLVTKPKGIPLKITSDHNIAFLISLQPVSVRFYYFYRSFFNIVSNQNQD